MLKGKSRIGRDWEVELDGKGLGIFEHDGVQMLVSH